MIRLLYSIIQGNFSRTDMPPSLFDIGTLLTHGKVHGVDEKEDNTRSDEWQQKNQSTPSY